MAKHKKQKIVFPGDEDRLIPGPFLTWKNYCLSTREARQAYFTSCYGNIYIRRLRYGARYDRRQDYEYETHMFIKGLAGNGMWDAVQWLNLKTNVKWDQSFRRSDLFTADNIKVMSDTYSVMDDNGFNYDYEQDWRLLTRLEDCLPQ